MFIKNTAGQHLGFALVGCCGAPVTGATVTVKRSIDGGSQASATGSVSDLGNGQYNLALSQADTNGDNISFTFAASNAVLCEKTVETCSTTGGPAGGGIKLVQRGTSSASGTATIAAVDTSKAFVLSKSKGSAGTVAATGSLSFVTTNGGDQASGTGSGAVNTQYTATPSLSGGTTSLTVKEYSAVLTNSTTVTFDGPVEWQVIEFY